MASSRLKPAPLEAVMSPTSAVTTRTVQVIPSVSPVSRPSLSAISTAGQLISPLPLAKHEVFYAPSQTSPGGGMSICYLQGPSPNVAPLTLPLGSRPRSASEVGPRPQSLGHVFAAGSPVSAFSEVPICHSPISVAQWGTVASRLGAIFDDPSLLQSPAMTPMGSPSAAQVSSGFFTPLSQAIDPSPQFRTPSHRPRTSSAFFPA
eukprot:TRINITY_DN80334_c0_g1_i1.p1 TRINITY_DN80334_c0_g1~~TRINITY_DN80334_c0_g1_i1.p1  ORF type:complete len:205 (-),score=18.50 TRINITY_DN80334_c0_g1_i1:133-747(-)